MRRISKRILRDERDQPIAVQIDYSDWLEIEKAPESGGSQPGKTADLSRWRGTIQVSEDPVAVQRRMREEWP